MARLDEAEQSARSGAEEEGLDPTEAVDFLRNLPVLWEEAPNSRRALAESLFESVDVLGLDTMHVEPTPAALRRGLAEAFRADELVMVGARGVGPRLTRSSGIWIPRLHRGRVLVTMGGARPPRRSVRSA